MHFTAVQIRTKWNNISQLHCVSIFYVNHYIILLYYYIVHILMFLIYGVSAGKRDQIEIFFKKKLLSKIDLDLIIWFKTFVISKKYFLSIWSLFPALTPYFNKKL